MSVTLSRSLSDWNVFLVHTEAALLLSLVCLCLFARVRDEICACCLPASPLLSFLHITHCHSYAREISLNNFFSFNIFFFFALHIVDVCLCRFILLWYGRCCCVVASLRWQDLNITERAFFNHLLRSLIIFVVFIVTVIVYLNRPYIAAVTLDQSKVEASFNKGSDLFLFIFYYYFITYQLTNANGPSHETGNFPHKPT